MVYCFKETFNVEGFIGLYKGAAAPLASGVLQNAAIFGVNGFSKHLFSDSDGNNSQL
jgi:hypothetical protein